jgi:hypothetical protein
MSWPPVLAALSLALWLYLLLGRSGFWQARSRIENEAPPAPGSWPPVVVIVPARNEAEHVETALRSLLALLAMSCMSVCCLPTVRLYRLAPFWTLSLPLAALLYIAMTIDSAIRHRRGVGGHWKGRMVESTDGGQPGTWSCSRCC